MPDRPLVALESTVIAHGLPYPDNLHMALEMESIVAENGAEARTIGLIAGEPISGLNKNQLELFAQQAGRKSRGDDGSHVRKITRRDLPIAVARRWHGATTVATTMWIAHQFGIEVFATGGIGGVHRGDGSDISADLQELAQTPVIVVCAGAKAILNLPATVEYLETFGIPVIGMGTDRLPAFYSRSTFENLPVDVRCDTPDEVAAIWQAKRQLGLPGGLLVTVPIPPAAEIPTSEIEPLIEQALDDADRLGLRSAQVTPFLLSRLADLSGERSLKANIALLRNNARVAAQISVALTSIG